MKFIFSAYGVPLYFLFLACLASRSCSFSCLAIALEYLSTTAYNSYSCSFANCWYLSFNSLANSSLISTPVNSNSTNTLSNGISIFINTSYSFLKSPLFSGLLFRYFMWNLYSSYVLIPSFAPYTSAKSSGM